MARGAGKNNWALFLLLLAGIVLGSFIAQATSGISALSWLNYGQKIRFNITFYFRSWHFSSDFCIFYQDHDRKYHRCCTGYYHLSLYLAKTLKPC